ncbi:MAG: hypothetical protein OCU24_05810 [Candidatus Methanospirare jalkutatii]|nr:hypothetical protein [Candidatus Methanospirare jalkutatii]
MKDPEKKDKRKKYIFEERFEGRPRVKWITDCLLGDIRTFLDGIENYTDNKERFAFKPRPRGGGNLSVPILIYTALEFVAALYTGNTKYMEFETKNKFEKDLDEGKIPEELRKEFDNRKFPLPKEYKIEKREERWEIMNKETKKVYYDVRVKGNKLIFRFNKKEYKATENVKEFIKKYFPEKYKAIPLLLWDGIRNGLVHTFFPKFFKYENNYIQFQFYVEDRNYPSHIKKVNDTIVISINVFELYRILENAIEDYLDDLKKDENEALRDKFIKAWSSIEGYQRKITENSEYWDDAEALLDCLGSSSNTLLLEGLTNVLRVYTLRVRKFIDENGNIHYGWIPAIRLW